MVVCVYLRFNYVNQREPTHHKQSDSSGVQSPDVWGERGERMLHLLLLPIPLAPLLTCMRSCATYVCVMDWATCERAPPYSSMTHLPHASIANQCRWHHFFSAHRGKPTPVDGSYTMPVTANLCGRRHHLRRLIITAYNPSNRTGSGWHQMVSPVLCVDKCGHAERAMTSNVWRGRQKKDAGKNSKCQEVGHMCLRP